MAKKNNQQEMVQVALDEHRWINTPVIYTNYGKDFTRLQQDIMLQVAGQLQPYIKQFLDESRYKDPERPKSIFTKSQTESLPIVHIPLAELGIASSHYGDADEALDAIKMLWARKTVYDEQTGLRKGDVFKPVFNQVYIPDSDVSVTTGEALQYHSSDDGKTKRKSGYIEVVINPEVAADVFDMSSGYFNHLERIANFCSSAYTSRLYLLLMAQVSKGQMHPVFDFKDLKEQMGLITYDRETHELVEEKYPMFTKFKSLVLNVARRDMDRLCEENKIEIQLASTPQCKEGYEPLYRGSVKRGNPEKIKFHIKRTPLGVARELELHRGSSEERLVRKLLELYPTLDEQVLRDFVASVPDELWNDFKKYAYSGVPKAVEQPHRWDGSPESFIMYIMKQWVEQKSVVAPVQMDMFANEESSLTTSSPVEKILLPGEAEWQKFLQLYNGIMSSKLREMSFRQFEGGVVYINASRGQKISFARMLNAHPDEQEILRKTLNEAYGGEVKISY